MNGLPRSWESFIQGIYARKKLVKFKRIWEEFSQEEARITAREEKMGIEDQDLIVQCKKRKTNHHQGKHFHPKRHNRNLPKFRCYTCDERGHFARDCPRNKNGSHKNKGNKRRNHAHVVEHDEPSTKKIEQESDDSLTEEEYFLIFALMGTITHGSNDCLIDSGASKHMIGFKESLVKLL